MQTVFDNWAFVLFLTLVTPSWLVISDFSQILKLSLLDLLDLEIVIDAPLALLRVHPIVPGFFGNGHQCCLLLGHLYLRHTLVDDGRLLVLDVSLIVVDSICIQVSRCSIHGMSDSLRVPGASNSIGRLAY